MRMVSAHIHGIQNQATKKEADGTPLHIMLVTPSLVLFIVVVLLILTPHVVVGVQLGQHLMGVRVDALAVVLCK